MMTPGTSTMLRARRRDVNVKPNRRLDRKSSRGMLYENEELRLRTININAEVERGQNDIKKLRRENEQLRREIWGLREEYDRLEGLLGKAKRHGQLEGNSQDEDSDEEQCDDEDAEYDEEEDDEDEDSSQCEHSADLDNAENQQKASSSAVKTPGQSRRNSLRVEFDGLSIVDEETETVSNNDAEQCADDGPSALPATHQANDSRHASFILGGVKPEDSENCAVTSNHNQVGGACFNAVNGGHRQEQQFFGKIKLPNGKEGVFMSDVMLPNSNISNGLQIYGGNNLTGKSYDFVSANGFSPNDYHILSENVWPDIPVMLPGGAQNVIHTGSVVFPSSQSHYNYTFTPVDSTVLPDGTATQDSYAFERPNNLPGIPDGDALLPNITKCLETNENSYLRGGDNTAQQQYGLNDDTYFGMGENIEATTTAVTSDDVTQDYYHRRGGPDLFISGAYPVTRSPGSVPVGGSLDPSPKQTSEKEKEHIPAVTITEVVGPGTVVVKSESDGKDEPQKNTENVQEVIDALETQIDSKLNDAVHGVRVVSGNCYVCLAKEDKAGALLQTGLTLRGVKINLEDVSRDTITVALSGVPHDVPDSSVARVVANYGTVIGEVERRLYKGVDTGERIVRLKPADADIKNIPSTINLAGSKATLRILKPDEINQLGTSCVPERPISGVTGATEKDDRTTKPSNTQTQSGDNPTKSLDSSFSTDRYRSQLNVRLQQPKLKTNRSMENIFGSTDDKTQHNTSLPIIDTFDTTPTKARPLKMSSETTLSETRNKNLPCERLFNFDTMESALPQRLPHSQQIDTTHVLSTSDTSNTEVATEDGRQKSKELELDQPMQGNRLTKMHPLKEPQSSPEITINHTPNIFSKLPTRVSKCQNSQILSTTDDSTDSVDFHLTSMPQVQSNPFMINFRTTSPNNTSSCCNRRPITPVQMNPFLSSSPNLSQAVMYQDIVPRDEHSVQCHNPPYLPHLQSPATIQPDLKVLSASDHQREFCLPQNTNSGACSPYSQVNTSYTHSIQPSNFALISNENLYMQNSAPVSFPVTPLSLPATFVSLSPNQPAVSLGPNGTSPVPKNNNLHANPNYFPNPPSSHGGLQVAPPSTNVPGSTGYFLSNVSNIAAPSMTYVPGNVAVVVPPSVSIPGSAEYSPLMSDLPTNTHPGNSCTAESANLSMPNPLSPNTPTVPASQRNSNSSQIVVGSYSQHLISEGNTAKQEPNDVIENTLEDHRTQSISVPSSPVTVRKQTAQRKASRKSSILSHQQSKSSGDEGPNHSPSTAHKPINTNRPPSPGDPKRKASRKMSATNSIGSHHNVDNSINESSAGCAGGPNATSSPNTKHKTSVVQRKFSTGVSGGTDAQGGGHTNVIDVSRSSSSGQDSPTKPDKRRRVSIYFNNKKGAAKRRDSFLPNGSSAPSGGILPRSSSLEPTHRYVGGSTADVATGHCAGAETTTTTCSDRERTNSVSSRTSSAAGGHGSGRLRKQSVCSARGGSGSDVGKVPWCGCWGNGCI